MTTTADPVACVVCDTVIADFNDTGLASAMSDHVAVCDGHTTRERARYDIEAALDELRAAVAACVEAFPVQPDGSQK